MEKKTIIWLISAVLLIIIGSIGFTASLAGSAWDITRLSTTEYETNEYIITDDFHSISINTDTADIVFLTDNDIGTSVTCYEQENMYHKVSVKNDTLVIDVIDTREWYEFIGIYLGKPKITIKIPQHKYSDVTVGTDTGDVSLGETVIGTVSIKTSTGDINLQNLSAGKLDLAVSTGKIILSDVVCQGDIKVSVSTGKANLNDIQCANLISTGDTGDINLQNVVASESLSIERDTGDVRFDSCDAAEISVETDTGDVTGSLKTDKVFIVETDTGKIKIPNTKSGGTCKIQIDTGDISIQIA